MDEGNVALETLGMEEGWVQELDGASYYYRPDFTDNERPFKDIRDLGRKTRYFSLDI
jgi:hypothetical protein